MVNCVECGTSDDFEFGDGTGYCRVCGTQSQDIREEVFDANETAFNNTRRIRILDSSKIAAPERIWTNSEALQIVLKVQTESLISSGYPSELQTVVGNIWFDFLAKLGQVVIPGVLPVTLARPFKICILDNLLILFLSLRYLDCPVTLSDIIHWITDGTIAYFNSTALLPAYFKPASLLMAAFSVGRLPTTQSLHQRLQAVLGVFGDDSLLDHSRTIPGIMRKLAEHYKVPFHDVQLLSVGLFDKFYRHQRAVNPDLIVAACFVNALRLFFQFEDAEFERSNWNSWFPQFEVRFTEKSVRSRMSREFVQAHPYPTEQYLLNCSLPEYLPKAETAVTTKKAFRRMKSTNSELQGQFEQLLIGNDPEEAEPGTDFKLKVKRPKISGGRKIVVYPTDDFFQGHLPFELESIITDVASHFCLKPGMLYQELQRVAGAMKKGTIVN